MVYSCFVARVLRCTRILLLGSEEERASLQRANRFFSLVPIYDTGDGVSEFTQVKQVRITACATQASC